MLCKRSRTNLDLQLTFYIHNFLRSTSHKKHTALLVQSGLKNSVHYRPEKVTLGGFQIKIDCRHLFDLACLCLSAALKTFCANVKKSCLASVQHYATSKVYQLDFKSPDFWSGAKIVKNDRNDRQSCLTYLELCIAIVTDNRLLA